jgi:hypothetical protein
MKHSARLRCLRCAVFLALACCVRIGEGQNSPSQLHSPDWRTRATAYYQLLRSPALVTGAEKKEQLLGLLQIENGVLDSRNSMTTAARATVTDEENYGEYYSQLLGDAETVSNFQDPRDLSILANSAYNPDSPFALRLVKEGGQKAVSVLLGLAGSNLPTKRANAFALLAYAYRTINDLPLAVVDRVTDALTLGTKDGDPMAKQEAVHAIGQTGDARFISVLKTVAQADTVSYSTNNGRKVHFPVREEAVRAIQTIEASQKR